MKYCCNITKRIILIKSLFITSILAFCSNTYAQDGVNYDPNSNSYDQPAYGVPYGGAPLRSSTGASGGSSSSSSSFNSHKASTNSNSSNPSNNTSTSNNTSHTVGDPDRDGVEGENDNCPLKKNPDQKDSDKDGIGNACDWDRDGDKIKNAKDNCPDKANSSQKDTDKDKKGDACDSDKDNDGIKNGSDNCPSVKNKTQKDSDRDGRGDACDNCRYIKNKSQLDKDKDGKGDACDNCKGIRNKTQKDSDKDGRGDACDNCRFVKNPKQTDRDRDKVGDSCDNCRTVKNKSQIDADKDGKGDSCDNCKSIYNKWQKDNDKDNIGNSCDNCPSKKNYSQRDSDQDGVGDVCQSGFVEDPDSIESININSTPKTYVIAEGTFTYTVETSFGEAVFSLVQSPNGMNIDTKTGEISWETSSKDRGNHEVIISANGTGDTGYQAFTLSVLGTKVVLSGVIGVDGGELEVTDNNSTLKGLKISIAKDKVKSDTEFSIYEVIDKVPSEWKGSEDLVAPFFVKSTAEIEITIEIPEKLSIEEKVLETYPSGIVKKQMTYFYHNGESHSHSNGNESDSHDTNISIERLSAHRDGSPRISVKTTLDPKAIKRLTSGQVFQKTKEGITAIWVPTGEDSLFIPPTEEMNGLLNSALYAKNRYREALPSCPLQKETEIILLPFDPSYAPMSINPKGDINDLTLLLLVNRKYWGKDSPSSLVETFSSLSFVSSFVHEYSHISDYMLRRKRFLLLHGSPFSHYHDDYESWNEGIPVAITKKVMPEITDEIWYYNLQRSDHPNLDELLKAGIDYKISDAPKGEYLSGLFYYYLTNKHEDLDYCQIISKIELKDGDTALYSFNQALDQFLGNNSQIPFIDITKEIKGLYQHPSLPFLSEEFLGFTHDLVIKNYFDDSWMSRLKTRYEKLDKIGLIKLKAQEVLFSDSQEHGISGSSVQKLFFESFDYPLLIEVKNPEFHKYLLRLYNTGFLEEEKITFDLSNKEDGHTQIVEQLPYRNISFIYVNQEMHHRFSDVNDPKGIVTPKPPVLLVRPLLYVDVGILDPSGKPANSLDYSVRISSNIKGAVHDIEIPVINGQAKSHKRFTLPHKEGEELNIEITCPNGKTTRLSDNVIYSPLKTEKGIAYYLKANSQCELEDRDKLELSDKADIVRDAEMLRGIISLIELRGGDDLAIFEKDYPNLTIKAGPGNDGVKLGFEAVNTAYSFQDLTEREGFIRTYSEDNCSKFHSTVLGEAGDDKIFGSLCNDSLSGGAGNDQILAYAGNDQVSGGAGNDLISLHEGNDDAESESGSNLFLGGSGDNFITGGSDRDIIYGHSRLGSAVYWDGNKGKLTMLSPSNFTNLESGTTLFYITDDPIDCINNTSSNSIEGGEGNDFIVAGHCNDEVSGGAGADKIFGESGGDVLEGGEGDDIIFGDLIAPDLEGTKKLTIVSGTASKDITIEYRANQPVKNSSSVDNDDNLQGGPGNDVLFGGRGWDQFYGGEGNDIVITGNEINDKIAEDDDSDRIFDIGGNDTYVIEAGGKYVINDFGGEDTIQISNDIYHEFDDFISDLENTTLKYNTKYHKQYNDSRSNNLTIITNSVHIKIEGYFSEDGKNFIEHFESVDVQTYYNKYYNAD